MRLNRRRAIMGAIKDWSARVLSCPILSYVTGFAGLFSEGGYGTHNAGVGSSSLPPAIGSKGLTESRPTSATTGAIKHSPNGDDRARRIATALHIRAAERDRELTLLRLTLRSGTASKVLG